MGTKSPSSLPEQFGRYRVQKVLGEGGMGSVYLARDTQLERDVALKVPQFSGDDVMRLKERFLQEARAAATIQHPNICPIFDVGEIDGIQYITMAFIDGKPLAEWVGGEKTLTERQIATLVRKVASAMHEAHKKGVIHRDLKPSNIMIDRRGEPIVMDFGLARRASSGDQRLTQSGAVMGSPAYMAPEQVKGDSKAVGPGCDIYSLGVILFELLTHRLPFMGDDNLAVLAQVLMDEPKPPSLIRPDLDARLEAICLKALAKKSENRFASMADLAGALQDYLRGSPRPTETQPSSKPRTQMSAPDKAELPGSNVARTVGPAGATPTNGPIRDSDKGTPRPSQRREKAAGRRPTWVWLAGFCAVAAIAFLGVLGLIAYQLTSRGAIRIEIDPATAIGVEIKVDGATIADPGKSLRLRTGDHDLEVTAPGFQPVKQPFSVHRGENQPVRVSLSRIVEPTGGGAAGTMKNDSSTHSDAANNSVGSTDVVDLLKLIDVNRDAVEGAWHIQNGDLRTPAGNFSRLQIPFVPPVDYQLDLLVERKSDAGGGITIGLVVGGHQTLLVIDGFRKTSGVSGLETVDGKKGDDNGTTHKGRLLPLHQPKPVRVSVRQTDVNMAAIDFLCDSKAIFHWQGNPQQLSILAGWKTPEKQHLFLGSQCEMAVHALTLTRLPALAPRPPREFASLFNGNDIRSWQIELGKPNQWSVVDGTIVGNSPAAGSRSYLLTKKEYANFVLRFEYKPEAKSAGVAIRGIIGEKMPMPKNGSSPDHPLLKLTSPEHPKREPNGTTHWLCNDKINTPPFRHIDPKPDEWHTVEVTVRDDKCTATIDGTQVVDLTLDRNAQNRPGFVPGLARERGKVGFQINTGTIRLRKIEIAELPEIPYVPLFNGRDLAGWHYEGPNSGVWQVDGGQAHFTLTDPPKQHGWLVTDREYGDFQLRLEFQLSVRANSGVALRWPSNAKKQMEIQIADDTWYDSAKTNDFEFTGSLYGVAIDHKPELKPLGQWNRMEIDIHGDMLRVEVNGKETLSISLNDPRVANYFSEGLSKRGRIGLQHWVGSARFRNVELREYPAN